MALRAWRLILDPPSSAAHNMSVDEALLEHVADTPPTLRLYSWARPSVSLGYRQQAPPWLECCASAGVDVVRRISGGGTVVHCGDLTYSVCAGRRSGVPDELAASYRWIRGVLVHALRSLGLAAGPAAAGDRAERGDVCFAGATGYEVELGGRKLIGSAQRRSAAGFLQHGSLRLSDDSAIYRDVLRCDPPPRPGLPELEPGALRAAIVASFSHAVGRPLRPEPLSPAERRSAARRDAQRVRDVLCVPGVDSSRFPFVADRLP